MTAVRAGARKRKLIKTAASSPMRNVSPIFATFHCSSRITMFKVSPSQPRMPNLTGSVPAVSSSRWFRATFTAGSRKRPRGIRVEIITR
jgi:hypothetical protein